MVVEHRRSVLVYTDHDRDWDYCMWECGVATRSESEATSVISCNADENDRVSSPIRSPSTSAILKRSGASSMASSPIPTSSPDATRRSPASCPPTQTSSERAGALRRSAEGGPARRGRPGRGVACGPLRTARAHGHQVREIADEEDDRLARLTMSRLLLDATVLTADREAAALFGRPTLPADESFGQVFKRTVRADQPRTGWRASQTR